VPPLLCPGDRCHVYEIVASLGTSGAAELYLGREPFGDPCVLKIMAAPGADKQRLRFAQEGVVLAKIAHANVVRVFGAGAWGERVWLAIERFGGQTLGDRLRMGGRPPLDDLLGWMQQVCSGLAEAHRLGIVHRNLTPESVVLGPGGLVKLGEFGMAKLASFGVVTTEDQQIGGVLYAAPEQLAGKVEIGPRADVYGLGVLLYEAVTGVRPMGPGPLNAMTAVAWHLREQARPLRERAPGAPADLEALVHQMLEKTPEARPVSVLEVHDRLRDVRVGLRAPVLREVRNAAPVERSMVLAPTQPMPASPGVTPPGEDRTAVLPAMVPVPASPLVEAPHRVARPEEPLFRPDAPGEVRVTGEPVESEARRSRPASRSMRAAAGAAIGAGALTLATAAAVTGFTLSRHLTGPAQGAGSDPPAPAPSASAPAASASAATPRSPGAGASKRPRAPAPRTKN
jgi:eukaryotic-like serine/threonine-protein kinase